MPLVRIKEAKGLFDHEPNNDRSIDIVAVHGLEENMTGAWTDPVTRILWLRDLLPEPLRIARVLTFGYDANATSFYGDGSADRIQQHAQTLVADIQADRSLENCTERPIIFVCHGLGGILVKKALTYSSTKTSKHVEHLYSIFVSTYAVLFFGTPHEGTDNGAWLASASHNDRLAQDGAYKYSQLSSAIRKDSETLQIVTDHFSTIMKQFRIFFFWEEMVTDFVSRKGYVVDETSAAPILDNTERAGVYANHAQMIRFSHPQDSSYRTVIEALVRYSRDAPSTISRRWLQAKETLARARSNEAFELVGTAFDVHNNNRPFQYERKISERPRNKHFYIPQVVSSIFTGREDVTEDVQGALWAPEVRRPTGQQRRYIIYGIGGSGKTQFCSKFAQDHRERFWGIFWIDATSAETAKQTFAKIGRLGGMEATLSAGKYWLSNLEEPWLLIINNADDPSLDLQGLFPKGERGHVLVTTRNPAFRVHNTVGSIEFKGLKQRDALLLLLRAADAPKPWNSSTEDMGIKITDALGCLALALIQAGALILQNMCGMSDYLDFYSQFRKKVGGRRPSITQKDDDQFTIHATWEHSINSLELRHTEASLDATQLLSTVAFFHFEHIRVDVFTRALVNRCRNIANINRPPFFTKIYNGFCARIQPPSILPQFLRQDPNEPDLYRIRRALHELCSFSLVSHDGKDDSFSLHPVVHAWARDRLDSGQQALWSQIALNVLAESIKFPPSENGEIHEDYRRDLLPHMDLCLRACPIIISDYQSLFGGLKFPIMLILKHTWLFVFRHQVLTAAKCGYVYLERGRFNEAAELFLKVKDALVQSRGYQNDVTMVAMLALAKTYWGLGRLEEAITLQKMVVNARTCSLGPEHALTLAAMNELGSSYWLNGQYNEALQLQTVTLERTNAALGPIHVDTLSAMDSLGVTFGSWQRFEESRDLHENVVTVRKKALGPTDVDTLHAMNNLAMALKDLGRLVESKKMMAEVYEQRKTKLGKEHPWTLWALSNLAKVNTELKLYDDAEDLLVGGIAAAKRSLGDDHLGVLMGVGDLALVYARTNRFDEAEKLVHEVIRRMELPDGRGPGHPDTVYAYFKLGQMYEVQSKYEEAINAYVVAEERSEMKLTKQHPMSKDISARLKKLREVMKLGGDKAVAHKDLPKPIEKDVTVPSRHHFIVTELSKINRHQTF